jgi:MYXO-CTERM domain-containing protein
MATAAPAFAEVDFDPIVTIDFSGFDGSGFAPQPAAGQLDSSDWSVVLGPGVVLPFGGEAGAGTDFARGLTTAGTDVDGVWAFDVDGVGLIALGVSPNSVIFTPGSFRLRLVNNTGADVPRFQVEYTVWINNDQEASSSFNLMQSADNTNYSMVGEALESTAAADGLGFVAHEVTAMIVPASPIADASFYYIAWEGADVSGDDRDEFGLEGITIRLLDVCGNGITETGEACDDGVDNASTAACLSNCAAASCGDGFVHDGVEECDDGNTEDGDECPATCTFDGATSTEGDTENGGTTAVDDDTSTDDSDGDSDGTASASEGQTGSGASETGTDSTTAAEYEPAEWKYGCDCSHRAGSGTPFILLGLLGLGLARRHRR